MTQAYSKKKETLRTANRTRTYDPPSSVLDALPLSLTRLKLGRLGMKFLYSGRTGMSICDNNARE